MLTNQAKGKRHRAGQSGFTLSGSSSSHRHMKTYEHAAVIRNISTEGVQYRAHVESDEQTDESRTCLESVRGEWCSQLPVERAPVEVMIPLTGWRAKCGLTTAGRANVAPRTRFVSTEYERREVITVCNVRQLQDYSILKIRSVDVHVKNVPKI